MFGVTAASSTKRPGIVVVAALLVAIIGFPSSMMPGGLHGYYAISEAAAQQAKPKKRRSLFSILFGRRETRKKAVVKQSRRNVRSKKSRTARNKAPAKPAINVVEKDPNAAVVLVIGDFFAGGLADGLTVALAEAPTVRVVDKSKALSGFVRTDVLDWSVELPNIIRETKPSYVIAMLGSNDRQLMKDNGRRLKKLTPQWYEAYGQRVTNLGKALQNTGVRYAWVGLPPVRFKSMSQDFLKFNELYAKAAKSERGKFFDVWDGFADADGNYTRSGPDINGQIVLLRNKDGINMTKAGKRRLSYYVEDTIKKLFGDRDALKNGVAGIEFDIESYSINSPQYDPAKTGKTFVIRLDDPSADGGETLAGEEIEVAPSLVQNLVTPIVVEAAAQASDYGRADNFAWPPQQRIGAPSPIKSSAKPAETPSSPSVNSSPDNLSLLQ